MEWLLSGGVTSRMTVAGTACWNNADVDVIFDDGVGKVTGSASTTWTLLLLMLLGGGVTSRTAVAGMACFFSASTTWTLLLLLLFL